jgi:hypothetical protein
MAPKRKTHVELPEDEDDRAPETRRKSARTAQGVAPIAPPGKRTRATTTLTTPRKAGRKKSTTDQRQKSNRTDTAAKDLVSNAFGSGDQSTEKLPSKYFRVSGIPADWSKDDILRALHHFDPSLADRNPQISVYPACQGPRQIALLPLRSATDSSRLPVPETDVEFTIDNRFHNLTPLNAPTGEVIAESDPIFFSPISLHAAADTTFS